VARRVMLFLLLLACLFVLDGAGRAQDNAKNKRTFYVVKHGDAKGLAEVLAKHFKGDAEVQVLPDGPSNVLLISAAPAVFDDVVKVLAELDRRPQLVTVDVLVADVLLKKGDDGKAVQPLDDKEFTGPVKDVQDKLNDLRKKGVVTGIKRIQLTAVEHQPASVAAAETKPFVMGVVTTATGQTIKQLTYRDLGTITRVKAGVAEKAIVLELDLTDTRAHLPQDGTTVGKDEAGNKIIAPEFVSANVKTKLTIPTGEAVAAEGVKTEVKSGEVQTLVIVTARVGGTEAKGGK